MKTREVTKELPTKKFSVVNEPFICEACGRDVPKTSTTTPRNHCPFCLWSKHVDINPGDRQNPCRGMLKPIGINTDTKKEYIIVHECEKCHKRVRTKAILKDRNAVDDFDKLVELSEKPIKEK